MNDDKIQQLKEMLPVLPASLRKQLKTFAEHPTERNECFIVGYLCAHLDSHTLTHDHYSLLLDATFSISREARVLAVLKAIEEE